MCNKKANLYFHLYLFSRMDNEELIVDYDCVLCIYFFTCIFTCAVGKILSEKDNRITRSL